MSKITHIKSNYSPFKLNVKEVFANMELLIAFVKKDIQVKYSHMFLGVLWLILNPLLTLVILTLIFDKIANIPTGGFSHLSITICGLITWTYFSNTVQEANTSLVNQNSLIKKVYFPRIIIPLSKAILSLVDFIAILILGIIVILVIENNISPNILLLPIAILLTLLIGLGVGVWMSALCIKFRDFKFITPVLLRLGLFASPIAFMISNVPEAYKFIFYANPITGIIEFYRWCILDISFNFYGLVYSILASSLIIISGLYFFNLVDKDCADVL